MNKEEIIKDFMNYLNQDIQHKDFLTYQEQDEWKDYINRIINNQVKEKDKEIERLNNIIDELKQKNNLARNILYDYLYNDEKITKERYEQFKELKEGK